MQTQSHTIKKRLKKMPIKICLITVGTFCIIGNTWAASRRVLASSSEYSLTANNITLDGTNNDSVTVTLRTSVARSYVVVQGTWSTKETAQTSYFALSSMKRGGTTAIDYGSNGICAWTPLDGNGMAVAADGEVLSATYTVDKDTPAGTYDITFSNGLFTYDVNGSDVDENDNIASTVTITVTRNSPVDFNTTTDYTNTETGGQTNNDIHANSDTSTNHDTLSDDDSANRDTTTDSNIQTKHGGSAVHNEKVDSVKVANSDIQDEIDPNSSEKSDKINVVLLATLITLFIGIALTILFIYLKKSKKLHKTK